jgi:hypothetical protein
MEHATTSPATITCHNHLPQYTAYSCRTNRTWHKRPVLDSSNHHRLVSTPLRSTINQASITCHVWCGWCGHHLQVLQLDSDRVWVGLDCGLWLCGRQ